MRHVHWVCIGIAAVVASLFGSASEARAQTQAGFRVGIYADREDAFLGGEVVTPVVERIYVNPNVELVLVERATFLTFNMDFYYDIPVQAPLAVWAGAGLAILYFNPEGPAPADTDVGLDLLFGIAFSRRPVIPYIQVKAILSDTNELVLGVGLRF
ncbi:hypothetical protein HRbin11_01757 [bacterium HR11]|nr:hypothetical protein HRbin11_01757 [bacterium HR11]